MSVVGIDLGVQSTKIGVARNKGIDIVRLPLRPSLFLLRMPSSPLIVRAMPVETN